MKILEKNLFLKNIRALQAIFFFYSIRTYKRKQRNLCARSVLAFLKVFFLFFFSCRGWGCVCNEWWWCCWKYKSDGEGKIGWRRERERRREKEEVVFYRIDTYKQAMCRLLKKDRSFTGWKEISILYLYWFDFFSKTIDEENK